MFPVSHTLHRHGCPHRRARCRLCGPRSWRRGPLPRKNFQSIKINRLENIVDIDYLEIVTNKRLYFYKKSEQDFCTDFLGRYYEKL